MRDYKVILDNVKKIIARFLNEHGGYDNGYETYVSGTVRLNTYSRLNWRVPQMGNITFSEYEKAGEDLYGKIQMYLRDIKFLEPVVIREHHIEYGTCDTTVSIEISDKVNYNDFKREKICN